MCSCFKPLLKAINAYLEKADGDLEDELSAAGFANTDDTMEAIRALEDEVAAALVEEIVLNDIDGTNNANARSRFRLRDKKALYRQRDNEQFAAYMGEKS